MKCVLARRNRNRQFMVGRLGQGGGAGGGGGKRGPGGQMGSSKDGNRGKGNETFISLYREGGDDYKEG